MESVGYIQRFRQRIARHRYTNWTTSVHTRLDVDPGPASAALQAGLFARADPPVELEHLWLCAAARVLRQRPLFFAHYDGFRRLRPRQRVHLRVSLRLADRLVWGRIEDADRLDPPQMAATLAACREQAHAPEWVAKPPRARRGALGRLVDDLALAVSDALPGSETLLGMGPGEEDGTFTVLNAGAFGAEDLHAVLLRPAVAMLVVLKPKRIVVPSAQGPHAQTLIPMAVPFCHKVMDTDAAGYFLFHLQSLLDDPRSSLAPPGED